MIFPSSGTEGALWLLGIAVVFLLAAGWIYLHWLFTDNPTPAQSTNTPLTDAAFHQAYLAEDMTPLVECSRKLERDLADAQAEIAWLRDTMEA